MTENQIRNKIVETAEKFIGYKESDGSHKEIIDIYNNYVSSGYKMKYTDPWCATFTSVISILCGFTDIMPVECNCERMIAAYKKLGRFVENDSYIPKTSDVIFYDWDDSGTGDNVGSSDHVGIVVSVSGNTIKVIEGNVSDSVDYRTTTVNARYIRGYGIPDYASKTITASSSGTKNTGGNGKMKYNSNNKPLVCMQTNSTCYKGTSAMTVKGILWHSTGANNPYLSRYVQPSDNASNRSDMLKMLGVNKNKNDWNHVSVQAGLNAWIGKLADDTVTSIQTMPWNFRPWGCGNGAKGSCNNGWIQFEICEDSLNDKNYFNKVYKEACELTAYLCKMYNLDPYGTTTLSGVKVPVILCHADSHKLGLGSNHGDVLHWFKKYGKTMDNVRKDVAALMNKSSTSTIAKTETSSASTPSSTSSSASEIYRVRKSWLNIISQKGAYRNLQNAKDACDKAGKGYYVFNSSGKVVYPEPKFEPYKVRVTDKNLNIRKGAGTNYAIVGVIKNKGVYTIVKEATGKGATKWGLLKSYEKNENGWISLDFCSKI